MPARQKVTTYLWFDDNLEEAMDFYVSTFNNSKILETVRYPEGGPGPAGSVMSGVFELEGQRFMGVNGGPHFKFNEAISLFVDCDTQEEVDYLWDRLIADGGEPSMCGWLKDKFGLSWQIIPSRLMELMSDPDPQKSQRVMQAMLKMIKIDVKALEDAYNQAKRSPISIARRAASVPVAGTAAGPA